MKRLLKIFGIGLVVVVIATLAITNAVSADTTEDTAVSGTYCTENGGFGGHGLWGENESCSEAVAALLGLTQDEVQALRLEGQSLVDIAAAQGVGEEELVAAIMAEKTAEVQARVEAGTLTQEQAELMLQNMEQRTVQMANRTTTGPAEGQGFGYGQAGEAAGQGMMNHWGTGVARGNGTGDCQGTGTGQMGRWNR